MKQERMPHEDGQSQEQQRTKKPSFFSYFRPSFKTAEQIVQEEGELKQKTEKLKGIDSSSVTSKGFAGVFEDMKKVGEGGITIGSVIYLLLYGGAFVQGKIIKYALKKIDSGFIKDFDANIKMITEFFSRKKEGGRVGGGKEDKKKLTESDVKEVESNIKRAAIENLLQTRQEVKQQNQWTQDDQAMYEKSWKELKRWAENKDIWTRENETLFVREVSFSEEDALTPQEQKRKTQIGQIKKKKEQRVS